MKLGIVLPQGFSGEYAGWESQRAWRRTLAVAHQAERLRFESVWVYDHVGTFGTVRDEPTFEAFAVLGAVAATTSRVRLGPLVARAGLRNPALLAKQSSTLDAISGGRFELGLGLAAPEGETRSFGYPVEPAQDRLVQLRDALEVTRAMFSGSPATYEGPRARIDGAINNPRGVQESRIPLIVGGNAGSTRRLAAELADELNLDGPTPAETGHALLAIAEACTTIGREPTTLGVSVHVFARDFAPGGSQRAELLAAYGELGLARVMAYVEDSVISDEALEEVARDATAAGVTLA